MEQYSIDNIELKESVLKIPEVFFDEISFVRDGNPPQKHSAPQYNLSYTVGKIEDSHYQATIRVEITCENEYSAVVQLSGLCIVNEDDPGKEDLLKENALAILFPYVRSEMSLITAQPGVEPIVWPVVNIHAMLEESAKRQKDSDE